MKNDIKSHLKLHLIVFIWGFTAILGALISIKPIAMVWYRMGLAGFFLLVYLLVVKKPLIVKKTDLKKYVFGGFLIAVHWILFFQAINVSNVSITLSVFSLGSFFASVLEPIIYNRKMLWYEVFFGMIIFGGLFVILNVEVKFLTGAIYALVSVVIGVLFTLLNGKLVQKNDATVISMYEFFAGFLFISIYLLFNNQFETSFFKLSTSDLIYILLLSSVCSAYAFTASVNVMKRLSPYTVMLTTNLEPVYGIFLAYFILGNSEQMSPTFYIGAMIILITVIANGVLKNKRKD
jgi:drug/metabolite transporter (DMT)-like permease